MSRSTLVFTSSTRRQRGGVGFYADDRNNNRLEEMGCIVSNDGTDPLPGELRASSKRFGRGQVWDLGRLAVVELCKCCGEEAQTNIVGLCGACATTYHAPIEAESGIGEPGYEEIIALFKDGKISADEAWARGQEIMAKAE